MMARMVSAEVVKWEWVGQSLTRGLCGGQGSDNVSILFWRGSEDVYVV